MPLPTKYERIQRYPANTVGRDFVVGDIHGMYNTLLRALTVLNFDGDVDRLFSVGDLVDRGPDSKKCAELIYEHWFYAVRGNHEQMMIEALVDGNDHMALSWRMNGGAWGFFGTPDEQAELKILAEDLNRLPIVMVVGEGDERFNIVHAEMLHREYDDAGSYRNIPITDQMIDDWCFSEGEENNLLWGRQLISGDPIALRSHHAFNMSPTYVGHTPIRDPLVVQQHIYLDGGAVFGARSSSHDNCFMIAEPKTKILHRYPIVTGEMQQIPYSQIDRQV